MSAGEQIGYEMTKGAFLYCAKVLLITMALLWVASLARNLMGWGTDDSDLSGMDRSGLKVHVDAKTGVEYLSDGNGGLVRREKGGSK